MSPEHPSGFIIGLGIDLVDLDEFDEILVRRGDAFIERVFTVDEKATCRSRHRPAQHFGARFAAKEAAFKALGTGWNEGVSWHDVEVVVAGPGTAPHLVLRGEFERRASALGVDSSLVSLTHTRHYASAVVALTRQVP